MLLLEKHKELIADHPSDKPAEVALQLSSLPIEERSFIADQIRGKQVARKKFPNWVDSDNLIYPPSANLAQSSSAATAAHKAKLISGESIADLTGGWGADTLAFAQNFKEVIHVEPDVQLQAMLHHNALVLGISNITFFTGTAEEFLASSPTADAYYLDPMRRSGGKRHKSLEDYLPNPIETWPQLTKQGKQVLLKLSPVTDIKIALDTLPGVTAVHVVSVDNDCKELQLLHTGKPGEITISASEIGGHPWNITSPYPTPSGRPGVGEMKSYLFEPGAAVLKAALQDSVASERELQKLQNDTHLYTSDNLPTDFPGRAIKVEGTSDFRMESYRDAGGPAQAMVAVRNFRGDEKLLRKRLHIKMGNEYFVYGFTNSAGKQQIAWGRRV